MEIFPVVMNHYLNNETTSEQVEVIADVLLQITRLSRGREILISILEFVDPMYDLNAFEMVAPCLKIGTILYW